MPYRNNCALAKRWITNQERQLSQSKPTVRLRVRSMQSMYCFIDNKNLRCLFYSVAKMPPRCRCLDETKLERDRGETDGMKKEIR